MFIFLQKTTGRDVKTLINTSFKTPPPPIVPRSGKQLKLFDIDPLELARQLTILEWGLFRKLRPMECLQRSREQRPEHIDNITSVILTNDRVSTSDW